MRHFTFALTALLLSLVFASRQANSSQEKMSMNVKPTGRRDATLKRFFEIVLN